MTDDKKPATAADEAVADDKTRSRRLGWPGLVVAGLFGLLYAYLVWTAVGNAINFPTLFTLIGHPDEVPTWLLVLGIAIPVAVYVVAFLLGLRHSILVKAVVFIMGLAASAALAYGVIALGSFIFSGLTPVV